MRTTFPFFLARSPYGSLALWLRAVRKVCGAGGVEKEMPPQSPAALCASLHFGRGLLPSPPHTRAASCRFSPLRPRASPPLSSPSPPPRFSPAAAPLSSARPHPIICCSAGCYRTKGALREKETARGVPRFARLPALALSGSVGRLRLPFPPACALSPCARVSSLSRPAPLCFFLPPRALCLQM